MNPWLCTPGALRRWAPALTAWFALAAAPPLAAQGTAPCPAADALRGTHLHGLWAVQLTLEDAGRTQRASLLLEASREHADGLSGAISRDGVKALVAGDVDAGELTMEESTDGRSIDAVWTGRMVESSCARQINGHWRRAGSARWLPFTMERHSGW